MKKFNLLTLILLLFFVVALSSCKKKETMNVTYTEFTLMGGTVYETKGYIIDSGISGPNVSILGGVHGNEHGGYLAATELKDKMIASEYWFKGKVLIIPKANILACNKDLRKPSPDSHTNTTDESGNLNRQFPGSIDGTLTQKLAYEIVTKIDEFDPKCHLDLHESTKTASAGGLGESIISLNGVSGGAATDILSTYNSKYTGTDFVYKGNAETNTSTYYFCGAYLGSFVTKDSPTELKQKYAKQIKTIAFTVETTKGNDEVSKEKHINMVTTILEYLWSND